jgi:hypothetical protein
MAASLKWRVADPERIETSAQTAGARHIEAEVGFVQVQQEYQKLKGNTL